MKTDSKTDKRPFAEKHPKLNFLFGLLLLLFLIMAFGYAMYMIGKYITIGVTAAANWLASLASKLDAVVIVTLITGCVSMQFHARKMMPLEVLSYIYIAVHDVWRADHPGRGRY